MTRGVGLVGSMRWLVCVFAVSWLKVMRRKCCSNQFYQYDEQRLEYNLYLEIYMENDNVS